MVLLNEEVAVFFGKWEQFGLKNLYGLFSSIDVRWAGGAGRIEVRGFAPSLLDGAGVATRQLCSPTSPVPKGEGGRPLGRAPSTE